jgi:hypothetical protein
MSLNEKICVIAANNSLTSNGDVIDYIKLASIASDRVKYYLGIPTYLITNNIEEGKKYSNFFDIIENVPVKVTKRYMLAGNDTIQYEWLNDSRINAYYLTKNLAKKILMIDADYMIASDQLEVWLNNDYPFMIFDHATDVMGTNVYATRKFPNSEILQRWATAICWNNSEEAEIIFKTAKMVRDNYEFYAVMLGFPKSPFRNDLAFSVACHLHNVPCYNYQNLWNLPANSYIHQKENKNYWLISSNEKCLIWNHDIHILNKQYAINEKLMNQLRLVNVET